MRPDVPSLLPLICPRCRRFDEAGNRHLHTLSVARAFVEQEGEIIEGELGCANPECGARYPILDGIPVVVTDVAAVLHGQAVAIHQSRPAEVLAALAVHGPDDAQLPRLLEHLSIYLDAHYADRARPPLSGPSAPGFSALAAALAQLTADHGRARRVVELGCSVGGGLRALAAGSDLVVGIDLHFGALRAARTLLAGRPHVYPRRRSGRYYARAEIVPEGPTDNAVLVCGDALDPPLAPGYFDRAVALNLIDSVRNPPMLVSVLDGLVDATGLLALSSPFSWQSETVDDAARPVGESGAAWLRERLVGGLDLAAKYQIVDEKDLMWALRRDERAANLYRTHWLTARRVPAAR